MANYPHSLPTMLISGLTILRWVHSFVTHFQNELFLIFNTQYPLTIHTQMLVPPYIGDAISQMHDVAFFSTKRAVIHYFDSSEFDSVTILATFFFNFSRLWFWNCARVQILCTRAISNQVSVASTRILTISFCYVNDDSRIYNFFARVLISRTTGINS